MKFKELERFTCKNSDAPWQGEAGDCCEAQTQGRLLPTPLQGYSGKKDFLSQVFASQLKPSKHFVYLRLLLATSGIGQQVPAK